LARCFRRISFSLTQIYSTPDSQVAYIYELDAIEPSMLKCKIYYSSTFGPILLSLRVFVFCILFQSVASAQKFSISFPIGSIIYQESESLLTVLIEGVSCDNTVIKCHQGLVSMVGRCEYIYRCKRSGLDTVEVFIRKNQHLQRIGQQVFSVKERPLPKASMAGLEGGIIKKGAFLAQQGISGSWFVGGNHWENCTIESFNLLVLQGDKILSNIHNEGNYFTDETKVALKILEHGDKVLISNIKGCPTRGDGKLKTLEFEID
jgi:hypothetical protein